MSGKLYTALERNVESETQPQVWVLSVLWGPTACTPKPSGSPLGASCLEIALSALIQPSAGAARLWLEFRLNRPAFYGNLKTLDIKSTPVYMRVFVERAIKAVWLAPGCSAFPSPFFCALGLFRVSVELSVLPFVYFQSIIFLTAVCSQQKVIKSMVTT